MAIKVTETLKAFNYESQLVDWYWWFTFREQQNM